MTRKGVAVKSGPGGGGGCQAVGPSQVPSTSSVLGWARTWLSVVSLPACHFLSGPRRHPPWASGKQGARWLLCCPELAGLLGLVERPCVESSTARAPSATDMPVPGCQAGPLLPCGQWGECWHTRRRSRPQSTYPRTRGSPQSCWGGRSSHQQPRCPGGGGQAPDRSAPCGTENGGHARRRPPWPRAPPLGGQFFPCGALPPTLGRPPPVGICAPLPLAGSGPSRQS